MKVKIRGGYGTLKFAGKEHKQGEVFEISEADYKEKHWVLDPVKEEKAEEKVSVKEEAVAESVAAEDAVNRMVDSPLLRRGTLKKGKK